MRSQTPYLKCDFSRGGGAHSVVQHRAALLIICVAIVCLFISPIGCVAFVVGLYASDSDWVHFGDLRTIIDTGTARLAARGVRETT